MTGLFAFPKETQGDDANGSVRIVEQRASQAVEIDHSVRFQHGFKVFKEAYFALFRQVWPDMLKVLKVLAGEVGKVS